MKTHRRGRITASNFSSILSFRYTESTENYISKRVMGTFCQLYFVDYKKNHQKPKMDLSSLHVDEVHPFLGASPDGLISCKCCGEGLLEMKCSYLFKNKTPQEACTDHHYHVYLDHNNSVRLKESSSWYTQIQGQMGVCKKPWCHFILYTKKGIAVDRIYFDNQLYEKIVKASKKFSEKYIVNALINTN